MAPLCIPCTQLRPTAAADGFRPRLSLSVNTPARDRIISFGKHGGRMLGSLPSSYLQWVSKNLRARDFEEWARLADEVLRDPVYRDRLEWEAAERILTGDGRPPRRSVAESPVSDLIDVSERFGWDNEDKDAWARIDFELLGTSKGGRIPRIQSPSAAGGEGKGGIFPGDSKIAGGGVKKSVVLGGKSSASAGIDAVSLAKARRPTGCRKKVTFDRRTKQERKSIVPITPKQQKKDSISRADSEEQRYVNGEEREEGEEEMEAEPGRRGNREERRERTKLKREKQLRMLRREVGLEEGSGGGREEEGFVQRVAAGTENIANPFPGRSSLLEKLRKHGA